jgi:hypothetical protein
MDRYEIRTLLAEVRDEAPTQTALDRLSRLGIPSVETLRIVWPSLLIHELVSAEPSFKSQRARIRYERTYIAVSLCIGVYDMSFRPRDLADRMAGRAQSDGYVRETIFATPRTGWRQSQGLSEVISEGRLHERAGTLARTAEAPLNSMRWLRTVDCRPP